MSEDSLKSWASLTPYRGGGICECDSCSAIYMARELIAARAMMKMAKKEGFGCRAEDNCGSPLCAAIRNYDEVVK